MPFLSRNGHVTLKVRVNAPIFNTSWENSKMHIWCKFCYSIANPLKISHRQAKFPRILSQNGQNDLEGQGQWPPFSIPDESFSIWMFGENLVILAKICDELSRGQTKFPRILSQNGQNDLEGQSLWPPFFNTKPEYPRMHVWCKFGDSNPNLWWVITWTNRIS